MAWESLKKQIIIKIKIKIIGEGRKMEKIDKR